MKKTLRLTRMIGICVCLAMVFAGCSTENSDSDFSGEEYDVSYMTGAYAEQLVRDGAKTVTGTLECIESDDDYTILVHEKKIVVNSNYEDGYYVADRNMDSTYSMGSDHGVVVSDAGTQEVLETADFAAYSAAHPDALYEVYLIGSTAELILPLDPAKLTSESE